VTKEVKF